LRASEKPLDKQQIKEELKLNEATQQNTLASILFVFGVKSVDKWKIGNSFPLISWLWQNYHFVVLLLCHPTPQPKGLKYNFHKKSSVCS